jgi:hypothetical protein
VATFTAFFLDADLDSGFFSTMAVFRVAGSALGVATGLARLMPSFGVAVLAASADFERGVAFGFAERPRAGVSGFGLAFDFAAGVAAFPFETAGFTDFAFLADSAGFAAAFDFGVGFAAGFLAGAGSGDLLVFFGEAGAAAFGLAGNFLGVGSFAFGLGFAGDFFRGDSFGFAGDFFGDAATA